VRDRPDFPAERAAIIRVRCPKRHPLFEAGRYMDPMGSDPDCTPWLDDSTIDKRNRIEWEAFGDVPDYKLRIMCFRCAQSSGRQPDYGIARHRLERELAVLLDECRRVGKPQTKPLTL
jgi:hypothetical protein